MPPGPIPKPSAKAIAKAAVKVSPIAARLGSDVIGAAYTARKLSKIGRALTQAASRASVVSGLSSMMAGILGQIDDTTKALKQYETRWPAAFTEAVAKEVQEALRSGDSLWPSDTGESRRHWRATVEAPDTIAVRNIVPHAAILNNAPVIRGNRNRHYLAGQRTVEKHWNRILDKSGAAAAMATDDIARRHGAETA